jgi:hypothetical protein
MLQMTPWTGHYRSGTSPGDSQQALAFVITDLTNL